MTQIDHRETAGRSERAQPDAEQADPSAQRSVRASREEWMSVVFAIVFVLGLGGCVAYQIVSGNW